MRLRGFLMFFAVAALGLTTVEASAEPAWCFVKSGPDNFENCGYYTQQQCLATASGVGGYCFPNPRAQRYDGEPSYRSYRSKRHSRY